MKSIQIISDVHTEFGVTPNEFRKLLVKSDIIVLSGDIVNHSVNLSKYLCVCKEFCDDVIYVSGNHEFYKGSTEADYEKVCELENRNSRNFGSEPFNDHFLQRKRVQVAGLWFCGATLWSNVSNFSYSQMNDPFGAEAIRNKHKVDKEWLRQNIQKDDIVVTHHLPSLQLIHPKYKNSPINDAFATDMNDMIEKLAPKLWCCGHAHCPMDITISGTRLVINPVGYPRENSSFENKIIMI